MSLESQIERLTKVIETLNNNLERALNPPASASEQPEQSGATESSPLATDTPSVKSVQDQCLALSRKDPQNKALIRALLDSFEAKKVADLGENLVAFAAKLGEL